jgi:hypothetical protein
VHGSESQRAATGGEQSGADESQARCHRNPLSHGRARAEAPSGRGGAVMVLATETNDLPLPRQRSPSVPPPPGAFDGMRHSRVAGKAVAPPVAHGLGRADPHESSGAQSIGLPGTEQPALVAWTPAARVGWIVAPLSMHAVGLGDLVAWFADTPKPTGAGPGCDGLLSHAAGSAELLRRSWLTTEHGTVGDLNWTQARRTRPQPR